MKKTGIVFLIILLIIVAAISAVCIWQWQNINAVVDGIRYDEQQLEEKAQKSEESVKEYLETNNIGTIRPLTEEEAAAVTSGQISEADAVKISTGKMTLEQARENKIKKDKEAQEVAEKQNSQKAEDEPAKKQTETQTQKPAAKPTEKPSENSEKKPAEKSEDKVNEPAKDEPEEEEEPEEVDYDTLISEKVAQLYIVKANFYAEFNAAWAAQKALYLQLPKSERSRTKKAAIVKSYMDEGLAMEKRYDAQVDTIIAELKQLLKDAGRSDELADSIREAYNQEKKAKKAQLINKYFG